MTQQRTLSVSDRVPSRRRAEQVPGMLILFSEGRRLGHACYPVAASGITLGRAPVAELFIDDPRLSRMHATFKRAKDGVTVEDLGSRNGTFIDDRSVGEVTVAAWGSLVRCGTTLLMPVADAAAFRAWPESARQLPMLGGPAIAQLRRSIALLARETTEVLVSGESGTGKELVAGLLHQLSAREGQLVPVNCAAMPESLFEAELFGVVKGAFTGAGQARPGLIRQADRGTLFLDELGELPVGLQAKLLRVVEQQTVRPVGSSRERRVDVRFVSATNRDLAREVARGAFREDLYHRLRGVTLELPPLRERRYDIVLLAEHLLTPDASALTMRCSFVEALLRYRWPGNVRELARALDEARHRATVEAVSELCDEQLRAEIRTAAGAADDEAARIRAALVRQQGHVAAAATELGISRGKLYALLNNYGIQAADYRR